MSLQLQEKQQENKLLQSKLKGGFRNESAASILHVDTAIPRGDEIFERDTSSQSVLVAGGKKQSKSERSSPLPKIQEVRKKQHFPAIGNYQPPTKLEVKRKLGTSESNSGQISDLDSVLNYQAYLITNNNSALPNIKNNSQHPRPHHSRIASTTSSIQEISGDYENLYNNNNAETATIDEARTKNQREELDSVLKNNGRTSQTLLSSRDVEREAEEYMERLQKQ